MFVVATLGSLGDLHPFLAIARALQERGETVLFLSQEPHRAEVGSQGLRFEPIVSAHDHARALKHPDLWHPVRGFGVLWRHVVVPAIDPTASILQKLMLAQPGEVRVIASPLLLGARLLYDLAPYDLTTAHTAPAGLRSSQDPMFIGSWRVPSACPAPVRRMLWRALDRLKLEPLAAPGLNNWREAHGLPSLDGPVFAAWLHSPHRTVALFPSDFGPQATDWPVPVVHVGFPGYLAQAEPPPDPELEQFIGPGSQAPLALIYPGSAPTRQHARLLALAAQFRQAGYRCLVIGATQQPADRLLCRPRVHMPSVLAQARVFVHHGGIGSIAHGMAANIRQIVDPAAYDQFDNAWRLTRSDPRHLKLPEDGQIDASIHAPSPQQPTPIASSLLSHSVPGRPNPAVRNLLAQLLA
jgi:rhamnosyltransferase subunit B